MLTLNKIKLNSHLLLGTAHYPSLEILKKAIMASEVEIVTVSLRREIRSKEKTNEYWNMIHSLNRLVLPNTAGCRTAKESIFIAEMAREIFKTNWIKLEVIGDDYTLQPDPFELISAARELIQQGFFVLPYCTDDLVLCEKLISLGCEVLMPWAAPIGSGQGILNAYALTVLRERFPDNILIIDAGIGAPSHACFAMELGFNGVLLNSAVANAHDPIKMAMAFKSAVIAGREGYMAGIPPKTNLATPSTPLIDTPFWLQTNDNQ